MTSQRWILAGPPVDGIDDYVARGGGKGLAAAEHRSSDSIISLIESSGLRGRGGAGFPTGRKMRSVAAALDGASTRHVIVNAAEGEPGTFKDRAILRHNAYKVIEGACIAATAFGATDVVVATKRSFEHEIERLRWAIRQMDSERLIDRFDVRIVEGPGEYLFGEETALLEVIDGRPPFPWVAPPYRRGVDDGTPGELGATSSDGPAVFVSNVETFANIPGILRHGADWFRSRGTVSSPGTIVCTVTGDTLHHGVGEVALGTTLRNVIEEVGGGLPERRQVLAVLNGVSNAPLSADQLDTPLTYEDMAAVGSGLGSASFIVVDDSRSLRQVAAQIARFLSIESCGQCVPCKRDGLTIASALDGSGRQFRPGEDLDAIIEDRLATVARGARCALAGQQERVVGRLLEMAKTATPSSSSGGAEAFVIAPLVDIVRGRARLDLAQVDKRPDWTYAGEDPDSHAWPAERLIDHGVEVRPSHLAESDDATDGISQAPTALASRDAFDSLRNIEARLEADVDALRTSAPDERSSTLYDLRRTLERHQRVTERFVYPLVRALDTEHGDEIAWYPQQHEQHATRLLHRLDLGNLALSGNLIDELCADVHASVVELQRRILPVLDAALATDEHEQSLVEAGVDDLVEH